MKKLLGITVVNKLLFEPHSSKICKKSKPNNPWPGKSFNSHFTKET